MLSSSVGVRYFTRGVDNQGHVANYVETEQIISCKQLTASFVQVQTLVCMQQLHSKFHVPFRRGDAC